MKPRKPAIVTIGNFDGVHLGHQMLMRQVVDRARALRLCSFAITFEPHPERVLFPERKLQYLTTAEERMRILQDIGIDEVWVCPFTPELARLEPDEFMRLAIEKQPIAELWVGSDFALGRGRKGTIAVLSEIGAALGWAVHMVPPYTLDGQVVSSTGIRTLLAAGAVRGVADLLGRNYCVSGDLEGDELAVDPMRALPKVGIPYDCELRQDGACSPVSVTVLPEPGRLQLEGPLPPHHDGPAALEFVRRT